MDETMPIPVTTTRLIFASSDHSPVRQIFCLSMIFSENRLPLFGIML